MNSIWAPWRIEYILGPKDQGCFLCAAFGSNEERERLVLHRGRTCAVVINKFPYNSGHLMVCPFRHIATLAELDDQEALELMQLTAASVGILQAAMKPEGFNTGINLGQVAGAGLKDHLHQHIVPRWNGDTNFMPVIGDTKVMPQALDALWNLLRPHFDQLPKPAP